MNKYFVQWTEQVTKQVTYSAFIEAENVDEAAGKVNNLNNVVLEDFYDKNTISSEFIGIDIITKVK